ncbi:apoptosis regulator Bcl-2-like [Salvelinus fontinalis]|uniref:apoptosis regulator Bcl-2-like n=1 Tax=Salvelinus fontinalis TaxID=8038 RepID=UPI002485450A|nr:apoptosis regulator Bcl-2-like [Salvelinus fontinalis]
MMANDNPYNSRFIVEKYIHHKLLKKGFVWEFNPENDSPNNGFGEPSPPDSPEVFARRSQPSAEGVDTDSPLPNRIQQPDRHARLHRVLREAGDEIEIMYQRDFAEMSGQLHFTPSTAQRRFTAVIEELFSDGVNWGRIVAFFEFGGTMCVESVNREMTSQVDNIAHWMTEYLNGPLQNWIQVNGDWDAFVEIYGQQRISVFHSWPYLKTVFGLAALGAAGVTIGALFIQK